MNKFETTSQLESVISIIEYQPDLQYTPTEALQKILTLSKTEKIDRVFIWHEINEMAYYTPGSIKRDMTNADMYWLLSKLLKHFMDL